MVNDLKPIKPQDLEVGKEYFLASCPYTGGPFVQFIVKEKPILVTDGEYHVDVNITDCGEDFSAGLVKGMCFFKDDLSFEGSYDPKRIMDYWDPSFWE